MIISEFNPNRIQPGTDFSPTRDSTVPGFNHTLDSTQNGIQPNTGFNMHDTRFNPTQYSTQHQLNPMLGLIPCWVESQVFKGGLSPPLHDIFFRKEARRVLFHHSMGCWVESNFRFNSVMSWILLVWILWSVEFIVGWNLFGWILCGLYPIGLNSVGWIGFGLISMHIWYVWPN